MKRLWLLFPLTVAALGSLYGAEPSTLPILRIEAGMHTAAIWNISADATGRLALTVSIDKTARLWELPSGRQLRILRPPIGNGNEGGLFACALSPDGSLAAVAGWTNAGENQARSQLSNIYVFSTSGQMVRRIPGLPRAVFALSFSANSRFLAATGDWGLRIFETATGHEVARDTDYGDLDCYAADWHGDNRLVTACFDGQLRLYELAATTENVRLTLLKKSSIKGGKRLYSARFSPDGKRIAVGFHDSAAVAVVDGGDLSFLFAPDVTGAGPGQFSKISWSQDGATLAGAGRSGSSIRRWSQSGRGRPLDTPVATRDTTMDLRALPAGAFLFAAADPAWGILPEGGAGRAQPATRAAAAPVPTLGVSPVARLTSLKLKVPSDGSVIFYSGQSPSTFSAQFTLSDRQLSLLKEGSAPAGLRAPRVAGINITDWENTTAPKLAGKKLPLEPFETSRNLAVTANASSFLLGTEWSLRSFTATGQERWKIPAPDITWAVNLADNDRLAVAAYGDGTIRWHRYDTGTELLAFFPHADRKRWVLWTPQGYYDVSPGAEELIGWHVNRGKDQAADFFPAAKFRDQFYRPDVIQLVLAKGDVAAALKEANEVAGRKAQPVARIEDVVAKMQPPIVELTVGGARGEATAPAGASSFTVQYRVRRAGSEAITRVRLLVDGRPADVEAPIPASDTAVASAEVPLPARDCIVAVLAENRFAVSEPATLRLLRAGAPEPVSSTILANAPAASKGKLYLLAVGVADLKMNDAHDINGDGRVTEEELRVRDPGVTIPFADLHFADADARDIAKSFAAQEGLLYAKVESRVLVNKEATAGAVKDGLEWIKGQTTARDVAVVFLSGHGENDSEGRFYFLAHEYDQKRRLSTGVSFAEIEQTIKDPAGKMIFFIDSCHAGNALGKFAAKGGAGAVDINRLVNELAAAENGAVVFASSTGRQQSLESPQLKHGLFAQAIIEGLAGKADVLGNGRINVSGLEAYVCDRVKEYSEGRQTPTVAKPQTVPDFPIAVKR